MKTVMKKMFCLMLVAVLMVGVMPFQAFAEGEAIGIPVSVMCGSTELTSSTLTVSLGETKSFDAAYGMGLLGANAANYENPMWTTATGNTMESGTISYNDLVAFNDTHDPDYYLVLNVTAKVCNDHGCQLNAGHTTKHDWECPEEGCLLSRNHTEPHTGWETCTNCGDDFKTADKANHKCCTYCGDKGHTVDDGTCPDMYCTSCGVKKDNKLHKPECTLIYDCCGGDEANRKHASDCPTYQACCGAAKPAHSADCTQYFSCCNAPKSGAHAATCTQFYSCCGAAKSGNHAAGCTTQKCPEPGCDSYNGHPGLHNIPCTVSGCTKLKDHDGEHTVACSTANCALNLGHTGEHKCACGLFLQKSSSHNESCPFYEAVVINNPNNTYSLKVWAKLWIGESLHKTILLDTITGLNGTEVVPYVIGDNVARLESKFPAGYKNIEWTKAVYYMIDSTKSGTVDTNMNVNEEDNVYINLYSQEKLVVVRVHTAKTYGVDRSVQVGGFRPGDVVSYDDVLKAVSKHYNVSSMKMYTYDEWEKVVAGSNGSTIPNFVVQGGDNDNVYEVYVTGTYKTTGTSTTYKADSSNPKTGDMIFAPAMVLGLSASALAVLYYLNKKRAF